MRTRRRQRGSAMLEFAIGASVFVALFTGTFQYGYTFYVYNTLETAVRAGARYGALHGYPLAVPTVNSEPESDFTTKIKNVVVYGVPDIANAGSPVARDLDTSHVRVNVTFENGQPGKVTVAINNYAIDAIFGTWTMMNKPSATFQFMGLWQPPVTP